jgi:hypothetical protein
MLNNLWLKLGGIGAFLALVLGTYLKGFFSGKSKVEKDALQASVDNARVAAKIRDAKLKRDTIKEYLDTHNHD